MGLAQIDEDSDLEQLPNSTGPSEKELAKLRQNRPRHISLPVTDRQPQYKAKKQQKYLKKNVSKGDDQSIDELQVDVKGAGSVRQSMDSIVPNDDKVVSNMASQEIEKADLGRELTGTADFAHITSGMKTSKLMRQQPNEKGQPYSEMNVGAKVQRGYQEVDTKLDTITKDQIA